MANTSTKSILKSKTVWGGILKDHHFVVRTAGFKVINN